MSNLASKALSQDATSTQTLSPVLNMHKRKLLSSLVTLLCAHSVAASAQVEQNGNRCLTENCSERLLLDADANVPTVFTQRVLENDERLLSKQQWLFHGLQAVAETTLVTPPQLKNQHLNDFVNANFSSGKHFIAGPVKQQLDAIVDTLKDKRNIKLHLIGHADSQRLSPRAKKIYQTNVGLSNARAAIVASYFQQQLNIDSKAISTEGKGSSEPIASNATLAGMAKNRRVEIVAWYDEVISPEVITTKPEFNRQQVCSGIVGGVKPFMVTLDGQTIDSPAGINNADEQRCTDVALDQADVQLRYDSLPVKPRLNLSTVPQSDGDELNINFQGYSNYQALIEKAQVRLFLQTQSTQSEPLAVVPLSKSLTGSWQTTVQALSKLTQQPISYRLRVYDNNGRFDESQTFSLDFLDVPEFKEAKEQVLLAGYGENHLAMQNIPISGGTMTVFGTKVPAEHQVYFLGQQVPVDPQGKFVAEQIIPSGEHKVEVALLDEEGNGQLFQRQLELKDDDWFYVGMADLTIGKNHSRGYNEFAASATEVYDNDFFADGRLAFYAKGKWQDKYTITTSLDSREEPLEDLFSNLDKKDPNSLLRRLEEESQYSLYGDDSTLIEDAPTQGRFYAKVSDKDSHLLWGNFAADIEDTELARVKRGLYGANLHWQSENTNRHGERSGQVFLFAAEAGTKAAYEEHRGTGGSLYYLANQDISRGSERVSVEVRDKDSNLVLSSRALIAGQDYDIDAIQGRVLLTKPLSSIANDQSVVRTGGVSGHPAYLVVNYEYTPGFESIQDLSVGGRASYWLNEALKFGVTATKQDMGQQDHKLRAFDLSYRLLENSYIKLETAKTEGQPSSASRTVNGGFNFNNIEYSQSNSTNASAKAHRIEAALRLSDLGLTAENDQSQANMYWQKRDQGFSGTGQYSQFQTEQKGLQFVMPFNEQSQVDFRVDKRDEVGGVDKLSGELGLLSRLNEQWSISSGLRVDDTSSDDKTRAQNLGKRTDLAVQLDYQASEIWRSHVFGQTSLKRENSKQANHRIGLGGNYQVTDAVELSGEVSTGNLGIGAIVGSKYQYNAASNLYLNYELDPDRTDNGLAGKNGQLVSGVRHRFSDSVSVYGEERYQHGDSQAGLLHAYGIEFLPNERWVVGVSIENGEQEQLGQANLERNALAVNLAYAKDDFKYSTALEYRQDKQDKEKRNSYLLRNNLSYQLNPDWRAQARVDLAISNSSEGRTLNSDYTEALFGFAYRPLENDKFNALVTYNYLYDLAPAEQFTSSGRQNDQQQRSHVFAFDASYDLSRYWTLGGKLAHKLGEVRENRESGQWFDSTTNLYILRADWHVVRHWDFVVEARMLEVKQAKDKRSGFLTALHYHVNQHFKLGVGYNFTDFSDSLTDLNYDANGWFINLLGKL